MSDIDESQRGLILSKLMDDKLGPWRFWHPPEIADHVGPRDLRSLEAFEKHRERIVAACSKKLGHYSDEQLLVLSSQSIHDPDEIQKEWHAWLKSEIYELKLQVPSWKSVGFGHPDFIADFDYWAQMDKLSLEEALLLSVGVDPKHYDKDKLAKSISDRHPERFKETIQFLIKRREVFARKFPFGVTGHMRVSLLFLKEWFDEIGMIIHPSFRDFLDRRCASKIVDSEPKLDDRKQVNDQELAITERETVLKLIAAMDCEGHRYDPNALRNSATKDIQDDVAKIGYSVDQRTVLKWLRLATQEIDEDYWVAKKD